MKKLLALLLAMAMILALGACGAKTEAPAEEPAPAEEAPVEEAPAEEAPAEEAPAEEAPAEEAPAEEAPATSGEASSDEPAGEDVLEETFEVLYPDVEPLTITFNCAFQENENGGVVSKHFKQALEGMTDGAITVNVSYGGTLFTADDELDACGEGAIQMMLFAHTRHTMELPVLCAIPDFAPGSIQNALDYFEYVMNDSVAGPIIEAEAEEYGIKYLTVNANGANYFLANYEFDSLADMVSKSSAFGNMVPAKYEALGLTVVPVFPWDYYTAFDTGLMDSSQMDGGAMYSMSLQEVAQYWMSDGTFAAGNFITVNLDWWNGLTDGQREAIQAAAENTRAYSLALNQSQTDSLNDNLIADGVTLVEMSDEEAAEWWGVIFDTAANEALAAAEQNGNVDDVKAVLQAAADFTGYDIEF